MLGHGGNDHDHLVPLHSDYDSLVWKPLPPDPFRHQDSAIIHRQVLAPFHRKRATRNFGCAMMNAATLKQIAAVKPIVSKGSHVWT